MTQRIRSPSGMNLETVICEKYMAKLLENELKIRTNAPAQNLKSRDKNLKISYINSGNKLKHCKQNSPSPKRSNSPKNLLEYSDETAVVKVTVKATNPRQRSRSKGMDQEPWGQILKSVKSKENLSIFHNFDPLRTLHFLVKELEFQLQDLFPENMNSMILQMIQGIQAALKRVPPEVASTIHLQQILNSTEKNKFLDCETQTIITDMVDENSKILKDNITKYEAQYKQIENISTKLKSDKDQLEKELNEERERTENYSNKIRELESENNFVLAPKIKMLEEQKIKLETEIESLGTTYENRNASSTNILKSQINEIKIAKVALEQENAKIKHDLRVLNIEKEKYITVLAARDRQINEIRSEMSQLQEAVNGQLMELQQNVSKTFPNTDNITVTEHHKKENVGDWNVSASSSKKNTFKTFFSDTINDSLKDVPLGDNDIIENSIEKKQETDLTLLLNRPENVSLPDNVESHTSLRSLFNEVKRTALAISISPKYQLSTQNENKFKV